jgi:hypothetical protein
LLEYLRSEFPHRPDSAAVFAAGLVDRLGAVFPDYGYPKATGERYHSIGKSDDHVDQRGNLTEISGRDTNFSEISVLYILWANILQDARSVMDIIMRKTR